MNFSGIARSGLFGKALRWPLQFIPASALVPIVQGRLRGYKWVAGSSNHGCWLGSYELSKQKRFAAVIAPGTVVYDIGANVGFYTLLAAELVSPAGRVIAFEPLPRNLRYLEQHVSQNNLSNVDIIPAAVAAQSGDAFFDDKHGASMGHLSVAGSLVVKTVRLDELVASGRIPAPDTMKIDVEGAEEQVLAGAAGLLSSKRPTIFLATHGDHLREVCLQLLTQYGYSIVAIDGGDLEDTDEFLATPDSVAAA
jgi:FkbM family methyltransferase